MTDIELKEILEEHQKWLQNKGGKKADLSGVDLRGADFHNVDLCDANLSKTDLRGADLSHADLRSARLSHADLRGAELSHADLRGVDLSYADLRDANLYGAKLNEANLSFANFQEANLHGANLQEACLYNANFLCASLFSADLSYTSPHIACFYDADLRKTKNVPFVPMACPDTGSFIAWKKASRHIIKLLIPEDAKRSSATSRKCRANKAVVLAIENMDGTPSESLEVESNYDSNFIYRVGETVEVKDFCEDRFEECAPGIHFFINREDAVFY